MGKKATVTPSKKGSITAEDNILLDPDEALQEVTCEADIGSSEPKGSAAPDKSDELDCGSKGEVEILTSDDERTKSDKEINVSEQADKEHDDEETADTEKPDEEIGDAEKVDDENQKRRKLMMSKIELTWLMKNMLEMIKSGFLLLRHRRRNLICHRQAPASLCHLTMQTSLLDVLVSVIPEQITPTPTTPPITPPTTTEAQANLVLEYDPSITILHRLLENQLPKLLSKAVSDFVKPGLESIVCDVLQKHPINLVMSSSSSSTTLDSFTEYELKNMLYDKMQKSGSFNEHQKHIDLYNALTGSIGLDEAITKGEIDPAKVLKKKCHDDKDQDPPTNSEKERRKDAKPSKKSSTSKE
ncbi:hypothetical protein Tco_1453157 [Tanacetum coccineum]